MTDRLPPVKREDLPPNQQPAFDSLAGGASKLFGEGKDSLFTYKRPSDGALVGPFPLFFVAPEAGEHVMHLFGKLGAIPGFPVDAKEVAILTVGAHYQAVYELYAHTNVATKKAGLTREVVDAIVRGEKPQGLNEGCEVAYDVTKFLASKPGPLPKELWERSLTVFGKEGTVALVHYVGAYAYTCIVLNAMDAPVPEE